MTVLESEALQSVCWLYQEMIKMNKNLEKQTEAIEKLASSSKPGKKIYVLTKIKEDMCELLTFEDEESAKAKMIQLSKEEKEINSEDEIKTITETIDGTAITIKTKYKTTSLYLNQIEV